MAEKDKEFWRRHVTSWTASGLSCRKYGEKMGLNHNTLNGWKRRFERASISRRR